MFLLEEARDRIRRRLEDELSVDAFFFFFFFYPPDFPLVFRRSEQLSLLFWNGEDTAGSGPAPSGQAASVTNQMCPWKVGRSMLRSRP